jgi:hypothetical protein
MRIEAFIEGMIKGASVSDVLKSQLANQSEGSAAISSADHGVGRLLASREHIDERLTRGLAGATQVGIPATAAGALIGAGLALLLDDDPMAGAGLGAVLVGSGGAAVGQASGQLEADAHALDRAGLHGSIPNPTRFALPYPVATAIADTGHFSVTKKQLPS